MLEQPRSSWLTSQSNDIANLEKLLSITTDQEQRAFIEKTIETLKANLDEEVWKEQVARMKADWEKIRGDLQIGLDDMMNPPDWQKGHSILMSPITEEDSQK